MRRIACISRSLAQEGPFCAQVMWIYVDDILHGHAAQTPIPTTRKTKAKAPLSVQPWNGNGAQGVERPRNVETFPSLLLPTFQQAWCVSQWAASKNAPRPAPPWQDQQTLRLQEPLRKLLPGWEPWTRLLPSLATSVNDSNQVCKALQ